jgi:hypothetical protein
LRKKIGVENLTTGALFWWSILMILVCVYMPGASYLFTWPLLFMLAPLWLMLKGRASEYVSSWEQPSTGLLIVLWLCGLPGLVLVTPLLYHVFIGLTLDYVWVVVMLLVLLLGLLVPHLSLVARPYRWLLPGAAAVACIGLLLTGVIRPDFDAAHPKPNSIFYGLDANAGTAIWASMDREPDEWSARFLSAQPQSKPLPAFFSATDPFAYLQTAAPVVPLDAPHVELLDDRMNDGVRTLHMRVTSPRQANELTLFLDSKVEVLRASVNGNLIDGSNTPALKSFVDNWILCYFAVPPEGIDLKAEVRTSEPLKVRVVDLSYGLTKMQGAPSMDRPDGVIPASMPANNSTLVSKSFVF